MFIPRVYYPHPIQADQEILFDREASHYLTGVLRLKDGEMICLFNGQGGQWRAKFHVDGKKARAQPFAFEPLDHASGLKVHIGQGLSRGDRMDYAIQKATELGAAEITPLVTEKCLVKLDEQRKEKRADHWQNIIVSACEQSGLNVLPQLHPVIPLQDWVKQPFTGLSLVFEPGSSLRLRDLALETPAAVRIAVGPESGFSDGELRALDEAGFTRATLGPRVLRTETAGIAALTILQGLYGDM